jgi:hypothetical protein
MLESALKAAEQRPGHVTPTGVLEIVPLPPTEVVSRNVVVPKTAVTVRAESSVTEHDPLPVHPPVQRTKPAPSRGAATRVAATPWSRSSAHD